MITTDKQLDACPYCGQDQSFDLHSKRYDSEAHRCVHTMKCRGCGNDGRTWSNWHYVGRHDRGGYRYVGKGQ